MLHRGIRFLLGISAIALGFCSVAQESSSGNVIRGNSNVNVRAANVTTMAVGSNNVAKTSIGSVKGGAKSGNVTVDVKNVTNIVGGHGRTGCVNIGTKGTDPDCQ